MTAHLAVEPRVTVSINDGSDKGGLKVGQSINVNGRPGKWIVVRVYDPINGANVYDIQRMPNRKDRRKIAVLLKG